MPVLIGRTGVSVPWQFHAEMASDLTRTGHRRPRRVARRWCPEAL